MRDIIYFTITGLLFFYCVITWIRAPRTSEPGYQDDKDLWIVGAVASWLWPVGVALYILYMLGVGFKWLVLRTLGPIEIKQAIEQIPDVIGSIPDTLKEKFEELERTVRRKNCVACALGHCMMNTDPLGTSDPLECAKHNAKGHHHVVWNGDHNEILECGSDRCNALTKRSYERLS